VGTRFSAPVQTGPGAHPVSCTMGNGYCLLLSAAIAVRQIPDAVDTVVGAPNDGRRYYAKHAEQFPDKINRETLHLVGFILEHSYAARTHER